MVDHVPLTVLRDRYGDRLGIVGSVVWWLVGDPDGPGVSMGEAASLLDRSYTTIQTHVHRARDRVG